MERVLNLQPIRNWCLLSSPVEMRPGKKHMTIEWGVLISYLGQCYLLSNLLYLKIGYNIWQLKSNQYDLPLLNLDSVIALHKYKSDTRSGIRLRIWIPGIMKCILYLLWKIQYYCNSNSSSYEYMYLYFFSVFPEWLCFLLTVVRRLNSMTDWSNWR